MHVLYEGPSRLDGRRITVRLTGLERRSKNRKTGDMLQTWIMAADRNPVEAAKRGLDKAVCGDCPLRGHGCYVTLHQAPLSVYRAGRKEQWPDVTGRMVRLGAYGDPAAVPVRIWNRLLKDAKGWTGYTHQWRRFPSLKGILMASVDSEEEREEAKAKGWRTFRIRRGGLMEGEIMCPASDEAGKRTTCEKCRLCCGTAKKAKDIAILPHGPLGRKE